MRTETQGWSPSQIARRYQCDVGIVERLHAGEASPGDYHDFWAARAEFLDVVALGPLGYAWSWRQLPWDARVILGIGALNVLALIILTLLRL